MANRTILVNCSIEFEYKTHYLKDYLSYILFPYTAESFHCIFHYLCQIIIFLIVLENNVIIEYLT